MPLIDIDLTNAPDEIKYELPGQGLRLLECTQAIFDPERYNKDRTKCWQVIELNLKVSDPDHPSEEGRSVKHTMFLPSPEDASDRKANALAAIKIAAKAFGVPFSSTGLDVEQFTGRKAKAEISHDPDKQDKTKVYARIKKFIVPA